MNFNGYLSTFPKSIRIFIAAFVVVLSIGYFTGLLFVTETSTANPQGIEENYLGNEADEEAAIMKFKKSEREMLTIIHTHILSMSFIFFLLGILVWLCNMPTKIKLFLTVEPFISVVLTFGGIYMLWTGIIWFKYIIMISGILMTATYTISALVVLLQLCKPVHKEQALNQ
ncbi:hypothetical protein [Maribacter sp. MAR_2009_72]|uniref:hypothetical protein n=1 Tax=Maribacter sp. MAR_2009_72 TaxID=1250050 RepID=UPI00119ADC35|nr:hypothetical protein [Maribacter sp. MAR_2009_72]TVZ17187.1 hypothetical protein JM81_3465 [Maribacter sp. MAR_2009_72]